MPQDGNVIPIEKDQATHALDAAACIGCGACVAACPNASAMLFVSGKVFHLALLPQGKVKARHCTQAMVKQMGAEGFGMCSNVTACEVECIKEISVANIARLNRDYYQGEVRHFFGFFKAMRAGISCVQGISHKFHF